MNSWNLNVVVDWYGDDDSANTVNRCLWHCWPRVWSLRQRYRHSTAAVPNDKTESPDHR